MCKGMNGMYAAAAACPKIQAARERQRQRDRDQESYVPIKKSDCTRRHDNEEG